ncbi:unnamed protein product [Polarella glacialis]|uniref:Uncharacterized protein n=1 Tax=Polarella glacialis TaxID=89957 RepID=A0A813HCG7_POLGL|nr:unnamed protein product [Polarella glacialis]
MEGLLVGVLCACFAFAVQSGRSDPVESAYYPGHGMRSRKMRSLADIQVLAQELGQAVFIVRLRGPLFFGNAHALPRRFHGLSCPSVVLDFQGVVAIDASAWGQLDSVADYLSNRKIELICSGLPEKLLVRAQRGHHLQDARISCNLTSALEDIEQQILDRADRSLQGQLVRRDVFQRPALCRTPLAPSEADCEFFERVCSELLSGSESALNNNSSNNSNNNNNSLRSFFDFEHVASGSVLWTPGEAADFAFLLVRGHVGVRNSHYNNNSNNSNNNNNNNDNNNNSNNCERAGGRADDAGVFAEASFPGQFTGELGLFTGEARENTIVATEDLWMWTVTRASLLRMQTESLQLAFALQSITLRYASHRMYRSMLDGHLHSV